MEVSTLLVGWGWTYDQLRAGWQEIEQLGFDACYVGDDLFTHHMDAKDEPQADAEDSVYETWTILSAMAATTRRMRIGSLVSPCNRRHPVLFAKMTTMVDIISGGRLSLGMGAGNAPDQYRSMGIPFKTPAERTAMLREELQIIKALWTEGRASFQGEYYSVMDAINSPKPIQQPHPEIHIAFKSKKHLPKIAAEFADRVNLMGAADSGILAAMSALREHCMEQGRDFNQIKLGRLASLVFTGEAVAPEDVHRALRERAALIHRDVDELIEEHEKYVISYVGPVAGCADSVRRRTADLGISEVVVCIDTFGTNSYERTMAGLRSFADIAIPQLREI
jgi:alkanesulfonate monooxygenase SsuD/methylene tetrahydromethanopterin reductase-like flavin-dependent oxidoreductase (luciferase family)